MRKRKTQMRKVLASALSAAMAVTAIQPTAILQAATTDTAGNAMQIWFDEPVSEGTLRSGMVGGFGTTDEDNVWQQLTLPIGNGSIGANIYGEVSKEHLTFNEKTLWNGGPSTSRPDYNGGNLAQSGGKSMSEIFHEVQQLYAKGKDTEANNLAKLLTGSSDGYGAYQSWGDIYLDYGFSSNDYDEYKRILDLTTAVSTVDFVKNATDYHREYFISYPDQVLAMKLTADGKDNIDLNVSFPVDNAENVTGKNLGKDVKTTVKDNRLTVSGEMQDNQMMMNGQLLVAEAEGGTVTAGKDGKSLDIKDATEVIIYVAADTNYKDEYPNYRTEDTQDTLHARVSGLVDAAAQKGYDSVMDSHEKDYKEIFDRVVLDLGQGSTVSEKTTDALLGGYNAKTNSEEENRVLETLLFQYGRYLTMASSRDGDLPSNLQGIWQNRVGDANRVPWGSDYHMNVNLQMNYWPTYSTNMLECARPLVDYINGLREPGEVTAQTYFGVEEGQGFTAHTQNTPFGWTCPGWDFSWGWSPAALPWILQNCYEYYEYSLDTEYLKENIYPLLKECALLYDNILMEKDGRLVSAPAYSPEHGPVSAGNTYEQSLIWQLYEDAIHSAEVLGVDGDKAAQWKETQSKLNPIEIGDSGQIKEWYNETTLGSMGQAKHRHMSHLLGLFPGDLINVDNSEYMDAAIVSLTERGYESTGWGIGQRINAWARTGMGDSAYKSIQSLFNGGIYPNLWDSHAPFQIDGNFGYTSGVAEMLMQSNVGYINVLPALPNEWSNGQVSGLVARGNFEVGMTWKNASPSKVDITSKNGGEVQVQSENLAIATVLDSKGNPVEYKALTRDRISFETVKGASYTIVNIPKRGASLQAPQNISAVRTDENTVELNWDAMDDAVYNVYRQVEDGDVMVLAEGVKEASYTDQNAPSVLGDIKYQIQAVVTKDGDTLKGKLSGKVSVEVPVEVRGMVDDRNSNIKYSSGWSLYTPGGNSLYEGTSTFIENPVGNETLELAFNGTGIEIYGTVAADRGMADIYIDGELHGKADSYAAAHQDYVKIYTVTGLQPGAHTIKVHVTNEKNPSSKKGKFEFDAFKILDENSTVSKITVSTASGMTTLAKADSKLQMTADVETKGKNKDVTWSVNNTSLAEINEDGLLTIKDKSGKVTVTAASVLDEEASGSLDISILIPSDEAPLDNGRITECNVPGDENHGGGTLNTDHMTWNGDRWATWGGEDGHLNGDKVDGEGAGDTMTFTFTGTKLEIYGGKNPTFSNFDVSIDGTKYDNVNVYDSADAKNQLLASYEDLSNSTHTITITVGTNEETKKTKICLDYFKVYAPLTGAEATVEVEDTLNDTTKNPEITYTGSWAPWNGGEGHHGGTKTESSTAGDTISYTFTGTGIDVYAPTNPSTTGASVKIDNEEKEPILTYGNDVKAALVGSYTGLENKEHTIILKVADVGEIEGSDKATRANFGLDYFVVHYPVKTADKSNLQTAIETGSVKYPEQYEKKEYEAFAAAYNAAVAVMNDESAETEAIADAEKALKDAIAALKPVSELPVPNVGDAKVSTAGVESKTLVLTWDQVEDAVSYVVYQGDTKVGETTKNYYRISDLTPDTEYIFRVEVVNRAGGTVFIGGETKATTTEERDVTPPEVVTGLSQSKDHEKTVTWKASVSEDTAYYEVWVNGTYVGKIPADKKEYSYDLSKLIEVTADEYIFTVAVVAVDEAGNCSVPVRTSLIFESSDKPEVNVVSVAKCDSVTVETSVSFEELKKQLPEAVKVQLSNDAEQSVKVIWDKGSYNPEKNGSYKLEGTLDLDETVKNPDNLKAEITVVVKDAMVTVSFDIDGETSKAEIVKGSAPGDKLPADPTKKGWIFMGWNTQKDGKGTDVTADTKFKEDTIVYAIFVKLPYDDVDMETGDWFYDAVVYAYQNGLMTGLDKTTFGPYDTLSRAQFAVILWRAAGSPETAFDGRYPDVAPGEWYSDAVSWATKVKVIEGYTYNGYFGTADNITREQMAVMMYRYAKVQGMDISKTADLDKFKDGGSVSEFAREAMEWAVGSGIIQGKYNGTTIDPQGNTARSECAIILMRYLEL